MPIYAYRCSSCGHAKDVLQKVSDPLLTVCPSCGAEAFQKQLTAAGFQLKGSGWYVTDFRGGASNGASGTPSGGEAKPDGGSGSADGGAGKGEASGGESKASAASTAGGCGTSCACH